MGTSNYEQLTDEQLIRNLRDGDKKIMDYIMEKYKNVVRKEAKAMYLIGGENDDLIQEGMIGLFKAVRDYDTEQEVSFGSFARLCIRRQMYSAAKASGRKKHIPLIRFVWIFRKRSLRSPDPAFLAKCCITLQSKWLPRQVLPISSWERDSKPSSSVTASDLKSTKRLYLLRASNRNWNRAWSLLSNRKSFFPV